MDFNTSDPLACPPLMIGQPVPRFTARSTHGEIDSEDYLGRWLILFSHPADFTPVCTSEFIALAKAAPDFEARDCALLGLSIDSLFSHLAWVRAIRELEGVDVPFPLIEDPSMALAHAFGMLDAGAQDAATVRTTFVIDPEGILRACQTYPAEVGRSIPEMLRLLTALQRVEGSDRLAPADWQPGGDLLAAPDPSPEATASADWFYRKVKDKRR